MTASSTRVAVLDAGVGNLRNVARALRAAGGDAFVTADPDVAWAADRLVLPGVGAFGDAMREIRRRSFDRLVAAAIAEHKPLLGICVGFQVLFEESFEFGRHAGLGVFAGRVARFSDAVVVPHVGWNQVDLVPSTPTGELSPAPYFYFVHSYRVEGADPALIRGWCDYDGRFAAFVASGSASGVQFHPEKSQQAGLKLLAHFVAKGRLAPNSSARSARPESPSAVNLPAGSPPADRTEGATP